MAKQHEGENPHVLDRLEALARQGVVEVGGGVPEGAPDPRKAFLAMVGYEVKPTKTILQTDPNMRERVDALWHEEAHRMGLIDRNGEFLLLFWFSGSPKREWRRMRDATSTRIPSRIATATGDPEFIAVSLDGRSLCAVSVEEYEDWIITHSFP